MLSEATAQPRLRQPANGSLLLPEGTRRPRNDGREEETSSGPEETPEWVRETGTRANTGARDAPPPGPATGGTCCWHSCQAWLSGGQWQRKAALGSSVPRSGGLPTCQPVSDQSTAPYSLAPSRSFWLRLSEAELRLSQRLPWTSEFSPGEAGPRRGAGGVLLLRAPARVGLLTVSPEAAWASGHQHSYQRTRETGRRQAGSGGSSGGCYDCASPS